MFTYTPEATVEYTRFDEPSSSWVVQAYYNENTREAFLNLETDRADDVWKYTDVSLDAYERLVTASSPGSHYNTFFKHQYGPGENLGDWNNVEFKDVEIDVADTPTYTSLRTVERPERTGDFTPKALTESPGLTSLRPVSTGNQVYAYSVGFTVGDNEFVQYTVEHAENLIQAAQRVAEFGDMLGVNIDLISVGHAE
jgi:hypothetical protein